MWGATLSRYNIHDPLFIRAIHRATRKFRESVQGRESDALSGEHLMDYTDKGPTYFPGHMKVAKRDLMEKLRNVDFVVEVRDARVPFSTANPFIDQIIKKEMPRLIIFNRADIANEVCNNQLQEFYEAQGAHVLFTNAHTVWRLTVETLVRFVQTVVPPVPYETAPHLGAIVGMPNVGKTTLLNALRLAHEFQFAQKNYRKARAPEQVGRDPGTTRFVRAVPVSLDPPITLLDTPGLTLPGHFSESAGRKLTLIGILPASKISMPIEALARQVYDVMCQSQMRTHLSECMRLDRVPVSFEDTVALIAERSGTSVFNQSHVIRQSIAHNILVEDFRRGRLGRFTLDPIPTLVEARRIAAAWERHRQREDIGTPASASRVTSTDPHHAWSNHPRPAPSTHTGRDIVVTVADTVPDTADSTFFQSEASSVLPEEIRAQEHHQAMNLLHQLQTTQAPISLKRGPLASFRQLTKLRSPPPLY